MISFPLPISTTFLKFQQSWGRRYAASAYSVERNILDYHVHFIYNPSTNESCKKNKRAHASPNMSKLIQPPLQLCCTSGIFLPIYTSPLFKAACCILFTSLFSLLLPHPKLQTQILTTKLKIFSLNSTSHLTLQNGVGSRRYSWSWELWYCEFSKTRKQPEQLS